MWIPAEYLSRSGKVKERNDCFSKYTRSELNNTQSQHVQKKTNVALIEIWKCAFGPSLFNVWITHDSFNNALLMWDIELIRLLETPRSLSECILIWQVLNCRLVQRSCDWESQVARTGTCATVYFCGGKNSSEKLQVISINYTNVS